MPVITQITPQKRRENRRNVFLDGRFAFGCNLNVIAKFRLREGMNLSAEQVTAIQQGEVRQECFDQAIKFLEMRLHSRVELQRKLMRREYGESIIGAVLDDLARMGYVNDERFAKTKALSAVQRKQHGQRRALVELFKSGVNGEVARRAVEDVYESTDTIGLARTLAMKHVVRLKKLEPIVAKRRLVGMLQRRGFMYEDIKPVIDEVLGHSQEAEDE